MSLNPIKSALSTFKLVLKETEHKSISPLTKLLFEATLILSSLIIYSMLYRIIEGDINAYLKPVFIAAQVTWLEPFVVWFFPLLVCVLRLNQHVNQVLRSRFFQKHGASVIAPKPHYFRLLPYQISDQAHYQRADNLHIEVKNWLTQSQRSLLYLSGESGAGKSSLLNAYLIPELEQDGYTVISCHAHADPISRLKQAVAQHINKNLAYDSFTEQQDINRINEQWVKWLNHYQHHHNAPVLLIIDQFEEFLIINEQNEQLVEAQQALQQLITQLEELNGVHANSLKLLLSFRSDYDGLIHDLQLPPMRSRDNWFKVSAFSHQAASQFLHNGMPNISAEQTRNILQSVSELEDRKGLYRPITLNFAGYLLTNQPIASSINMNKLIQQFFHDLVHDRKHGANLRRILPLFITAQDTKQPVNVAQLAEQTQLPLSTIIATLNHLVEKGLAKPLDVQNHFWELSHDFIARKISPVLNQYRTPMRVKVAKHSIAMSLALWGICIVGLSVYALQPNQNIPLITEQMVALKADGSELLAAERLSGSAVKGLRFKHAFMNDVTLAYLPAATAQQHVDWHGLHILDLSQQAGIAHLHLLTLPRELHTLNAEGSGIFSLNEIKWPKGTVHLNFRNTPISDIHQASWPDNLQSLNLSQTQISQLDQVSWPNKLRSLDLRDTPITQMAQVAWPDSLQTLYADWSQIEDLAKIQWPESLQHLDLSLSNLANLEDITWPSKLNTLQLRYTDINDLAYAQWPRNLQSLDLSGTNLSDIRSAYWPAKLQHLSLAWTKITSIADIRWPKSLLELNLSASNITRLDGVIWPPNIRTLDLSATNLNTLSDIDWPQSLTGLDLRRTNITDFRRATWPANLQMLGCHAACFADAEQKLGRKLQNLDQETSLNLSH